MRTIVPPRSQVFTCGWISTGKAMLALPDRRFMVALDPVLFFVQDPQRYRTWYELVRTPQPRPAEVVREVFGAQFVLCEKDRRYFRFVDGMSRDPGATLELQTPRWVLFRIAPP